MIIRPVQIGDIGALSELAAKTYSDAFGHTFSKADLAAHLANNLSEKYFLQAIAEDTILVADLENSLIGFAQFGAVQMPMVARSPGDQELRRLYVHCGFRSRGIGGQLMEAALEHPRLKEAENIFLDVWEHNHGAQRFYRRYRFAVIGAHSLAVASGLATDRDLVMIRRSRS